MSNKKIVNPKKQSSSWRPGQEHLKKEPKTLLDFSKRIRKQQQSEQKPVE